MKQQQQNREDAENWELCGPPRFPCWHDALLPLGGDGNCKSNPFFPNGAQRKK